MHFIFDLFCAGSHLAIGFGIGFLYSFWLLIAGKIIMDWDASGKLIVTNVEERENKLLKATEGNSAQLFD